MSTISTLFIHVRWSIVLLGCSYCNAIIVPTIASLMTTLHVQGTLCRLGVTLYPTFYFLFNRPQIDTKEILSCSMSREWGVDIVIIT